MSQALASRRNSQLCDARSEIHCTGYISMSHLKALTSDIPQKDKLLNYLRSTDRAMKNGRNLVMP
jgi:hypothetical protein